MKRLLHLPIAASLLFNFSAMPLSAAPAKPAKNGIDLFALNGKPAQNAISIKEAVDLAQEQNSSIQIAAKNAQIYDQQVRQYWSYVYPQITLSGAWTYGVRQLASPLPDIFGGGKAVMSGKKFNGSATAEASLLLWAGGAVKAGIKLGDYYSQSGYLQLVEAKNKIRDSVTSLCFGIVLSHALIQVQQESLDIAQNHLKEINLKHKQGLASDLDILNQKVKISNTEPPLIQAKNAYEIGLLTLRSVLNKDPQEPLDLSWQLKDITQIPVPQLEDLYQTARENRPDLVTARLNMQIAAEQIK
ncbi:MAG: TolC family protein, partial [Elusimicrobiota bacterium]|nr:TolC family protein [Elusimicrobiota bacterium]